jgi:hypothetical protein
MTLLVLVLVITAIVVAMVWAIGFAIRGWKRRGWEDQRGEG